MNKNRSGLILGTFLGLFHALWCVMVVTGAAQWMLNWVFKLHFLNNPFVVAGFSWKLGLGLVLVTFVFGYIIGWVLALLWNLLQKKH